jgi:prepilin-type N-terminal cleavage/methylation domain-containing protein
MRSRRKSSPRSHKGFTLVELIACTVLLGTVMVTMTPLLAWVASARRDASQRQLALAEAANILERFAAEDWEAITAERTEALTLSQACREGLRDPALRVSVVESSTEPPSKRISVELDWQNRVGDRLSPVRLAAWVYRQGGTEP